MHRASSHLQGGLAVLASPSCSTCLQVASRCLRLLSSFSVSMQLDPCSLGSSSLERSPFRERPSLCDNFGGPCRRASLAGHKPAATPRRPRRNTHECTSIGLDRVNSNTRECSSAVLPAFCRRSGLASRCSFCVDSLSYAAESIGAGHPRPSSSRSAASRGDWRGALGAECRGGNPDTQPVSQTARAPPPQCQRTWGDSGDPSPADRPQRPLATRLDPNRPRTYYADIQRTPSSQACCSDLLTP